MAEPEPTEELPQIGGDPHNAVQIRLRRFVLSLCSYVFGGWFMQAGANYLR